MPPSVIDFIIADARFRWGTSLAEVADALSLLERPMSPPARTPRGRGPASFTVEGGTAFGLPVAQTWLMAPGWLKPVLAVSYELGTVATPDGFGEPDVVWQNPRETLDRGDIAEYQIWMPPPFEVRLSRFAATRTFTREPTNGALSIDWRDQLAAAAPFLAETVRREESLTVDERVATFHLGRSQSPIRLELTGHPLALGPLAESSPELVRRSLRALHHDDLVDTPFELSPTDVALWKTEDRWALSTRWDTAILAPTEDLVLDTARGLGVSRLTVDDLVITDDIGATSMEELAAAIASHTGRGVAHVEPWGW